MQTQNIPTGETCPNQNQISESKTKRKSCGLSKFIGLALPRHEYMSENGETHFILDTSQETFLELQSTAYNAGVGIDEWIEVIGNLLSHAGTYSPEEFNLDNIQSVGWPLSELAACSREIRDATYILDHASLKAGGD